MSALQQEVPDPLRIDPIVRSVAVADEEDQPGTHPSHGSDRDKLPRAGVDLDGLEVSLETGFAWQLRSLPNPTRHKLLVKLVVLVDVEVSHVFMLGLDWGEGTQ